MVGAHVDFTIDEQDLGAVDGIWWARAVCSAAAALIEVNDLAPDLRRSLTGLNRNFLDTYDPGRLC